VRVAEVTAFGGPEVLQIAERPDPVAGTGQLVVAIRAAAVNPSDIGTRAGQARRRLPDLEPPFVPGWDLAGEVSQVGEGVSAYAAGDRVVGMIPFTRTGGRVGAYAEAAAVQPGWLAPLDPAVSFEEGATLPLNSLTAREALRMLALPPGARLLITGAGGAVGGFATQLAVAAGLEVIAVAGRNDEDWVAGLGPAEVLPRDADLGAIEQVEGVIDAVPLGPAASTPALRDGGTAVFTRPPDPPESDRDLHLESFLVSSDAAGLRELAARLAAGELRTRVARTLPLDEVAEAHLLTEAGGLGGKVVLTTG
jgi:NADPH:quinone reductase-like Zn-dependent oxidoreductase